MARLPRRIPSSERAGNTRGEPKREEGKQPERMGEREKGRKGEWEKGRMGERENGRMGERDATAFSPVTP
jgi:hypothetical protein